MNPNLRRGVYVPGKMVISRKPLAVRLNSFRSTEEKTTWGPVESHGTIVRCDADVISVRGTKNRPKVSMGRISESYVISSWSSWTKDMVPTTVEDMLDQWDGRYGVFSTATWDGRSLWTASLEPGAQDKALAVLGPALEMLPEAPKGYTDWFWQGRAR